MEISQGLFFTVAVSLFASFVLAKLLSFVSACEAEYKTVSAKTKDATCELKDGKGSAGCVFENERRVRFIEDAVMVDECEGEEVMVEVCEFPLVREIEDDNGEACRGVELGEIDTREEERESVGGGEVADTVVDKSRETSTSNEIEVVADQVLDESPERSNSREMEIGVLESEGNMGHTTDETDKLMEINKEDGGGNKEEELLDEWEWEGIERSELENCFGAAVAFVDSKDNAGRISVLDNDVKMELCWLHKVAIEGPCCEPQPMGLKVFARAKWNAWKRPENMGPEVAMEHYIALLSRCIPNWMGNDALEFKTTRVIFEEGHAIEVGDPNLISKEKQ